MPTELNIEFAKIIIINNDLAEIIVKKDTELTLDMVHLIHQTLRDNLTAPFFLLVNKIYDYSYDFDAMHELGAIKELKGIAVICYSAKTEKNSKFLSNLNRKTPWNMKTFNDHAASLEWIKQQK